MAQPGQQTPPPQQNPGPTTAPPPTSNNSTSVSIPQTAAAGGLTFTQPPQTAAASFFKIAPSQPITFGWNFTSLLVTPTHLTISAVCDNGNTYPIGPTDGVIPGTATQVVWDPYAYQQANPLTPLAPQASYTLKIWDDRGSDAPRQGGYFQANTGFKFALYSPQPYTPIASGWTCPGCNGAMSSMAGHPAFLAILASLMVMLISGWGLLRHH